jgi:photosystem II stability/assembly factor-like uncharacterized protein
MNSEISPGNSSSHGKLRVIAASVICLALLACSSLPVAAPPTRTNTSQPKHEGLQTSLASVAATPGLFLRGPSFASAAALMPPAAGESSTEEPDARDDWFYFQRTYPSFSLPRDARRAAWQSRPRIESNSVSASAAGKWESIGPSPTSPVFFSNWGPTSGRINAVAVSPANPRIVIAGSSTGGIWRSTNDGESFVPVTDDQVDLAVGSISFSKSNPSIVYAGMGDTKVGYLGSGVLKSTDGGRTWSRMSGNSLPSPGTISKIEVDPADSNRVYAAQYSKLSGGKVTSSGLYVSTDGGINWTRTFTGAPRDVAIDPGNSRRLYLGVSRIEQSLDPPFGLYLSTDRGSTWSALFTAEFDLNQRRDIRVALTPADTQTVYAYFGGRNGPDFSARLRISRDGGATWSERNTSLFDTNQFGYNTYIVASPADANTVYLGSRDIFKSTDAGVSWTNKTLNYAGLNDPTFTPERSTTHADQHALAFVPGNPEQFFVGNDGGISKSTDGGSTFRSLNATLTLAQIVGLAVHPTDRTITYIGTQDNGTQRHFVDQGRWYEIAVGDGGHVVINPLDPSMVFITYVRGSIYRFFANGTWFDTQLAWNSTFGEPPEGARIAFYPPFTGNGVDQTLYFGTWRLFISANLGDSWLAPAGDLDLTKGVTDSGRDVLSAIAVARSDPNHIYTGSVQGRAMVSGDGGRTWTDVTHGLPDRSITSVAVDAADPATAYLAVSGFNTSHVFKTTNSGETWANISSGLPDIPVNALLIDPVIPNTLYAGTDIGVFRSTDRGSSWRAFNKGIPPVVVHEFTAQPSGLIQVATYGRGAYEFAGNPRPTIDSASFDGKKKLTISGSAFGEAPRVLINGVDKSGKIKSSSDSSMTVKGKSNKLGLTEGDNTVQVITSDDAGSNVVTVRL